MAPNNEQMVTTLYHDPSVVVIRREESLTRLQNNINLAQSQHHSESRLYPLLNRIVSDLCSLAKHDSEEQGSRELQCHSQALFPVEENHNQVPDVAACVFSADSLDMFPAFWFEGKALPLEKDVESWQSPKAHYRAMEIFANSIPQLRQQVNNAFECFEHGPTSYHVFLLIGTFWSLLVFEKQQEDDVRDYIEQKEAAAKQELVGIAKKLIDRKNQASVLPAAKRRRITKSTPAAKNPEIVMKTDITVPDRLLPQLKYVNEPLVVGSPVENYSPNFLKAVNSAMAQNHFVLQPSWFNVPPNFNSHPDLTEGIRRLRSAYERDLKNIMSNEKVALEDHLYSPPQDSNDTTYRPPRRNMDNDQDRQYDLRSSAVGNHGTLDSADTDSSHSTSGEEEEDSDT
ncbi:hypothetical protein F5051DRAFT_435900 [Lentinula edodes]|nr:hypothetical protein F5051DRAFT_435900 [Lentinula edodes]